MGGCSCLRIASKTIWVPLSCAQSPSLSSEAVNFAVEGCTTQFIGVEGTTTRARLLARSCESPNRPASIASCFLFVLVRCRLPRPRAGNAVDGGNPGEGGIDLAESGVLDLDLLLADSEDCGAGCSDSNAAKGLPLRRPGHL